MHSVITYSVAKTEESHEANSWTLLKPVEKYKLSAQNALFIQGAHRHLQTQSWMLCFLSYMI